MNIRDRGLRLAGYLTPPSDITQEDDDGTHAAALAAGAIAIAGAGASSSLNTIETGGGPVGGGKGTNNQRSSVLKVDKPSWAQLSAPALTSTPENQEKDYSNTASTYVTDEIRINVPTAPVKVRF